MCKKTIVLEIGGWNFKGSKNIDVGFDFIDKLYGFNPVKVTIKTNKDTHYNLSSVGTWHVLSSAKNIMIITAFENEDIEFDDSLDNRGHIMITYYS